MKPRKVNKIVEEVTKNIIKRSKLNRLKYLQKLNEAKDLNIRRDLLSCGNIAHSVAGCSSSEKKEIISGKKPNIAIVSAYNDMLSAHKPYENYPVSQTGLAVTNYLSKNVLSLPMHPYLNEDDIIFITQQIYDSIKICK